MRIVALLRVGALFVAMSSFSLFTMSGCGGGEETGTVVTTSEEELKAEEAENAAAEEAMKQNAGKSDTDQ